MLNIETLPERIQDKIMFEPMTDYWLWTASLNTKGYGKVFTGTIEGREISNGAHRYIYETLIGAVPEGLDLDHLCRV